MVTRSGIPHYPADYTFPPPKKKRVVHNHACVSSELSAQDISLALNYWFLVAEF